MPYEVFQLEPIGATEAFVGTSADPIKRYGEHAAAYMLRRVGRLPVDHRAVALDLALSAIDPSLPGRVERKTRAFTVAGDAPDVAARRALAAALSEGMLTEMVELGRRGTPKSRSLLGLGTDIYEALGEERIKAKRGRRLSAAEKKARQYRFGRGTDADPWRFPPEMIDGTVRQHGLMALAPFKKAWRDAHARYGRIPFVGAQIQKGMKAGTVPFVTFTIAKSARVMGRSVTRGQKYGVYHDERGGTLRLKKIPRRKRGTLEKLGGALRGIGKAIIAGPKKLVELGVKAGEKLYEAGKDIVDRLGDLACGVVSHPAAGMAAAGGASASGVPPQAGAAGVDIAKGLCGGAGVPGVPPGELMAPPGAIPGWVLPVGIGVGAVVLALALRRRR